MKHKNSFIMAFIVVALVILMCVGYCKITADHKGDVKAMMEEQYFYLKQDDDKPQLVMSHHTPQIGEEVYVGGKYYLIDRVIYNIESHNLNVYCHAKE